MTYDIGAEVDLHGCSGPCLSSLNTRLLGGLHGPVDEGLINRLDNENLSSTLNPLRNLILGERCLWS